MLDDEDVIVLSDTSDGMSSDDDGIAFVGSSRPTIPKSHVLTGTSGSSSHYSKPKTKRKDIVDVLDDSDDSGSETGSVDFTAILRGINRRHSRPSPPSRLPSPIPLSPSSLTFLGRRESTSTSDNRKGKAKAIDSTDDRPLPKSRSVLSILDDPNFWDTSDLGPTSPEHATPATPPRPRKKKRKSTPELEAETAAKENRAAVKLAEKKERDRTREEEKKERDRVREEEKKERDRAREEAKKVQKVDKQRARDEAKAAKEAEKSYQKKLAEVNRLRTSKIDALRDIELHFAHDLSLPSSPIAGAMPEIKQRVADSHSTIHFQSEAETVVGGTIRFRRHVRAEWDEVTKRYVPLDTDRFEWEPTTVLIASADDVVERVSSGDDMLVTWIASVRSAIPLAQAEQLVVLIRGMDKYHARTKSIVNRQFRENARAGLAGADAGDDAMGQGIHGRIDKETMEAELLRVQVVQRVFIVQVERTEDIEDWLFNLAGDVAVRPHKLLSKSHLPFSAPPHQRKSVDPTETLELMLQEVQGLTAAGAQGIAEAYPSFRKLMVAYEYAERRGEEAAADLVVGCEVRSLKNGAASKRQVGKALSRKVHHIMRGTDPLALT